MRRKIEREIREWLASESHEPLLIKGARRVGKTFIVTSFLWDVVGSENHIYLDFQTDLAQLDQLFAGRTDVERIVSDIEVYAGKTVRAETSVIVFDEVQLSERALNSLRFFAASPYRVVATGSLLGVTLRKTQENPKSERALPFPGDVRHLTMHPMDMEEFLWALDKEPLARGIRQSFEESRPLILHDEAMELYRRYLVVGGMPKAVAAYAEGRPFQRVREIQAEINETYISDMPAKYAALCQGVWNSIPKQLARESSRKFKYGDVVKGGRADRFAEPLAENYVMQALVANGLNPFYWTPGDSSREVEFVLNTPQGFALSIEVKSGENARSISLRNYMKRSECPLGIRISTQQFGEEGALKSIPLYATFCIE